MQRFKHFAALTTVVGVFGIVAAGCLDRDVVSRPPSTNTTFTTTVHNQTIDKVDLLFMIDNSASMGDKQSLLALAVPVMINRLASPNCLDANGNPVKGSTADQNGNCPTGQKAEFAPVHDMHIGILSSSLGSRGGNVCPDDTPNPANMALNAHQNDNGELINRTGVAGDPTVENGNNGPDQQALKDSSPDNFLSYFPSVSANNGHPTPPTPPITSTNSLVADFTAEIEGVHEHGCAFEAQNEAWYRFLAQPDPFATISPPANNKVSLSGIDANIIKQRAAFLRPDSLLAVIVVTDENEEAADPLSIGGQGWAFDEDSFPGSASGTGAPQGTVECGELDPNNPTTTGPNDPKCTSCAFLKTTDPDFGTECPKNGTAGASGYLDPKNDNINLRFFHQKERFGLFAGYPVTRYIIGLQKTAVPSVGLAFKGDSDHEHDGNGNYIGDQSGQQNCVNPIYAQNLPTSTDVDLCHLTAGPRTPDLVYYAAIAGVPHQLLQATPGENDQNGACPSGTAAGQCPQKDTLSPADWELITGKDPVNYDFSGADFHMIEQSSPRTSQPPLPGGGNASPPTSITAEGGWANQASCAQKATTTIPPALPCSDSGNAPGCSAAGANADPYNGCEFITSTTVTNAQDLEFSCIFPLVQLNTSTNTIEAFAKDCTNSQYSGACDCAMAALDSTTQLCDTKTPTTQLFGKAYPSVREMVIAHAMSTEIINGQVSNQGIVSSLCPIALDVGQPLATAQADPLFGYNPAVNAIINRLKASLSNQCVPEKLSPASDGSVQCLILVAQQPNASGQSCSNPGSSCTSTKGLLSPSTDPTQPFQQAVLDKFCSDQETAFTSGGGTPGSSSDPAKMPVCAMQQVIVDPSDTVSCATNNSSDNGWCYVQGAGAQALGCPAGTIVFTAGLPPHGATTSLQCLESSITVIDSGGGGG